MSARLEDGTYSPERLLRHPEWQALLPFLGERAAAHGALAKLAAYAALILSWNRGVSNLISSADEGRVVTRHLLESLQPAAWLRDSGASSWIDLGSGAGFPAIPLAIAGVGAEWVLVESRRPKVLFLRRVAQDVVLPNVTPIHSRLEQLRDAALQQPEISNDLQHRQFDAFTSRATMRLDPTLLIAGEFVRPGGSAFLWKSSALQSEIAAGAETRRGWKYDGDIALGTTGAIVCKFLRSD
jgi:16S rRNA (guanine527-N7)-methyltransferase